MASLDDPYVTADDVPSPIDFHDPAQARAWLDRTVAKRPQRPRFFAAFAAALDRYFPHPFELAELGSGPGHLAAALLQGCAIKQYRAVDFSPAMNGLARETLGARAARVKFIEQDFRDPRWTTAVGPVDAVVTMQSAHEIRHRRRLPALFAGVFEIVRPGGLFLYSDHFVEGGEAFAELYLPRSEQPAALAAAGFVDVRLLLEDGGMALYWSRRP